MSEEALGLQLQHAQVDRLVDQFADVAEEPVLVGEEGHQQSDREATIEDASGAQ